MKTKSKFLFLVLGLFLASVLNSPAQTNDPLPSWKNSTMKTSILDFVMQKAVTIPDSNRIAVFDMDGTIACEAPLWFEMYVAINGLNQQWQSNPNLLINTEYQYARFLNSNPFDTLITHYWASSKVNYVDSMVWKAYAGYDNEIYIDSARAYLTRTKSKDTRFDLYLADLFYQPMLELINLLKSKNFSVYIVSGSVQGLIWSICPQTIGFERDHLIGTTQILNPGYDPNNKVTRFFIQKGIFSPKNDKDGKSKNIYSHIGKVPVFAFGNTTGDFGMFNLTSTSPYPNVSYLLNHDDPREYVYPPWHGTGMPAWQDTMAIHHWNIVNMSENFKTIWMKKD